MSLHRCTHCGVEYERKQALPPSGRGYCSVRHRSDHQQVLSEAAAAERARKGADLRGPITPEEMASWDDDERNGEGSWLDA